MNQDQHLVAELNQADQMHEQPGVPGQDAGELSPELVRQRLVGPQVLGARLLLVRVPEPDREGDEPLPAPD